MQIFPAFARTAIALPLGVLSCSSPPGEGSNSAPSSTVSFQKDVLPVFIASCAFDGCHNVPSGQPLAFLGEREDDAGTQDFERQVYLGIVGKPAVETVSMPLVTRGDPSKSFLMHKMDGELASLGGQCAANNPLQQQYQTASACGSSMPFRLPLLAPSGRDIVRLWIQQGAPDN